MDGTTTTTFGARLRQLRERAGFTQEQLAERAGITGQAIGALERGDRKRPYAHTIHALAVALELSASDEETLSRLARRREPDAIVEAPTTRTNRLSVPLTPLYGRSHATSEVFALLQRDELRLLTMTGPGGVGKTRLAADVATESASAFPDDIVSVSLVPLTDSGLVLTTIAEALGIRETRSRTIQEALRINLASKRMLLVLDNFEHVLDAAPDIADLLVACPSIKILVTSRAPLRLRGEQEFPVQPLAVPEVTGDEVSAGQATEFASIVLFVARALEVDPSFSLNDDNVADIAEICRRLDGLPLAIELAAARTRLFSPEALRYRLTNRLSLLTGGARDLPDRQRTMRDAIAWSHDLCAPSEQQLFRRMAVFTGGATLDAIEDVSRSLTSDPELALDVVSNLVHHNLVVQERGHDGEPRFRMLETIREFAWEQLATDPACDAARDAHADYYARLGGEITRDGYTSRQAARILEIEPEIDNIRTALEWLIERQPADSERTVAGLKLAGDLVRFWDTRGHQSEGIQWLTRALDQAPGLSTEHYASVLISLAAATLTEQPSPTLRDPIALLNEAVVLCREKEFPAEKVRALWYLGLSERRRGNSKRATEIAEHMDRIVPKTGISIWHKASDYLRAYLCLDRGDGARAREHLLPCLDYLERHSISWGVAWASEMLGHAALLEKDAAEALVRYQQSLAGWREQGDIYGMLDGLLEISTATALLGNHARTARMLGTIAAIRVVVGERSTFKVVSIEEVTRMAQDELGPESFDREFTLGQRIPLESAVTFALTINAS